MKNQSVNSLRGRYSESVKRLEKERGSLMEGFLLLMGLFNSIRSGLSLYKPSESLSELING